MEKKTLNPNAETIYVYDMANRYDSKDRSPIVNQALQYLTGQTGVKFKRATFGMRNDAEVIKLNWADSNRLAEQGAAGDSVPGSREVNLISPRGLNLATQNRGGGTRTIAHEILHSLNIGDYYAPNGISEDTSSFFGHAKNPFNLMFPMGGMTPAFISKSDTEQLRNLVDYYNYETKPIPKETMSKSSLAPLPLDIGIDKKTGRLIPKHFAAGGYAMGTDTVPAMLTPGEFVMSKYAVQSYGTDTMKAINSGSSVGDSVYNYNLNLNVKSDANPDEIARAVMVQIKSVDAQRIRGTRI
jgi:hypothetical protein